ncbi:MAG: VOC family protein [Gammaproteobacteria bacterium]|nr:VOC family protein [Gammaproteobacteria bacterium]
MNKQNTTPLFHLAFPVNDLESTRKFYGSILNCKIGRELERWVDFDFFGHQITAHFASEDSTTPTNEVDGHKVPVRHFGAILEWSDWETLAARLSELDVEFLIKPYVRFKGEPGEQGTFFINDPSGNTLEFKSFRNKDMVFEKWR